VALRARREGRYVANDNLGGELVPALIGVLVLGLNGWLAISAGRYIKLVPIALVSAPFFLVTWYLIRRRARSKLGTFMQTTGAYFVAADGADVALYSWASLRGVQLVNQRFNGVYMGTNVVLDFGGTTLAITARDAASAHTFSLEYERHGELAREALARDAWGELEGADLV
jgi:hypothetical protein